MFHGQSRRKSTCFDSAVITAIPAEDILSFQVEEANNATKPSPSDVHSNSNSNSKAHLVVRYAKHTGRHQELDMFSWEFEGTREQCRALAGQLQAKLPPGSLVNSARKYLAIINPEAGHRRSPQIYRTTVEPMLKVCNVTCDVYTTSKTGDAEHEVRTRDLTGYSGLLVLGGDGSMSQVVQGLLQRSMDEARRDISDPECSLLPNNIPVSTIPTGTGNWLCEDLQGNQDVATAVIHVIKGRTVPMSVVTVHESGRLLSISMLVIHVGFVGDIFHRTETNRWLGPIRIKLVPHATLLRRRVMDVDIAMPMHDLSTSATINTGSTSASNAAHTSAANTTSASFGATAPSDCSSSGATNHSTATTPAAASAVAASAADDASRPVSHHPSSSKKDCHQERLSLSRKFLTYLSRPIRGIWGSDDTSPSSGRWDAKSNSPASAVDRANGAHDRRTSHQVDADEGLSHSRTGLALAYGPQQNTVEERIHANAFNICLHVTKAMTTERRLVTTLGQHTMPLLVVKKCRLTDFIKHLVKLKDNAEGIDNFEFVESRDDVDQVKMTLKEDDKKRKTWYMNCDGECVDITPNTTVCFRIHPCVYHAIGPGTG